MIYQFETDNQQRATAALMVYAVYKSRDISRFKVSTKMWEQITGFVKLAAKRSINLAEFIEYFRKPMKCEAIQAKYCKIDKSIMMIDGALSAASDTEARQFLTSELEQADQKKVISTLIKETAFVIMLVRERLENEKQTDKIQD